MKIIINKFVLMIKCDKLVYKGTKPKVLVWSSVSFPANPCFSWDVGE